MAVELFGFTIAKSKEEQAANTVKSFVPPAHDDGAVEVAKISLMKLSLSIMLCPWILC